MPIIAHSRCPTHKRHHAGGANIKYGFDVLLPKVNQWSGWQDPNATMSTLPSRCCSISKHLYYLENTCRISGSMEGQLLLLSQCLSVWVGRALAVKVCSQRWEGSSDVTPEEVTRQVHGGCPAWKECFGNSRINGTGLPF